MKKLLPVVSLAALIWGCAQKITPATSETSSNDRSVPVDTNSVKTIVTAAETLETAAVIAGEATYNAKCGRCHTLKTTTDYTAVQWVSILELMAPKANLSETEKAYVYAYVKKNSKKIVSAIKG